MLGWVIAGSSVARVRHAQTGSVSLFWVFAFAHDRLDIGLGVGADLGGLAADALGRPVCAEAVVRRHMFTVGGMLAVAGRPGMGGHTLAFKICLYGAWRDPHPQFLLQKLIRHRVITPAAGICSRRWTSPRSSTPKRRMNAVQHTFTHFHLRLSLRVATVPLDAQPDVGCFLSADQFRPADLPTVMRKAYDIATKCARGELSAGVQQARV